MDRNVVGSIYGRSSMGIAHSVLIRLQTWPSKAILVSYWLISKTAFPLKLLGQMIWNLEGSIYGRSSITIAHSVPIMAATNNSCFWLADFWKSSSVKLLCQNEPKFGGKHLWKVLYYVSAKQNERWVTQAQLSAELLVFIISTSTHREMMQSCKCSPHVNTNTLLYNQLNNVIIANVIILNIIHNMFYVLDTDVVICIILVLLERTSINIYN
jgi:hypothetical protein